MMAYCLRAWLEKILPWSTDRYRTAHVSPTKCQNAAHSRNQIFNAENGCRFGHFDRFAGGLGGAFIISVWK